MCEIPKWTRKKFELATKEALNPIKQDEKKGEVPTPNLNPKPLTLNPTP